LKAKNGKSNTLIYLQVLDFPFLHVRSSLKKHILREMIFVVRKKAVI